MGYAGWRAPRWSDGVNPSTGRPWPAKAQETQGREKQGESWIDINRLLFSKSQPEGEGLTSFQQLSEEHGWNGVSLRDPEVDEDGETKTDIDQEDNGAVSSFSPQHDDTLVQEIAAWISDRLPLGNAERRAIAEQRDKLIEQNALTLYSPKTSNAASPTLSARRRGRNRWRPFPRAHRQRHSKARRTRGRREKSSPNSRDSGSRSAGICMTRGIEMQHGLLPLVTDIATCELCGLRPGFVDLSGFGRDIHSEAEVGS